MQVVKLNEPGKRTWINKIKEAFKALYWEMAFSKSEILTYYLSHLPFGGNVEGFRAASLIYFGKTPKQLSLSQFVTLSIIPNQPTKLNPIKNPELLKNKRNQFLKKMWEAGEVSESEFIEASLEPIFASKHPLPKKIPHLARKLLQNPDYQIQTTIDSKIQNNVEQILEANTISLQRLGIKNAAVLIAEIKTGQIVSWIGNSDFNDKTNAGEVDGVEALRSPGSTLKPFIYEMALRKGLITPKTVLYDIPTEFSSYVPENYDQEFRGKVFADQSLLQSLNIPAIELLKTISIDSLLKVLKKNGMKKLMQNSKYSGLSLAVGGSGTNLYELVQAYCTLADHGFYKPLIVTKQKNGQKIDESQQHRSSTRTNS
jgi:penicillin-binding protein 1C